MATFPIEGSVTVITGASSGIGRAAAAEFARAGARVVLASRDEAHLRQIASELDSWPAEVLAVPTDVTRDDQVESLVQATLARFGRIDILICNAGVGLYSPVKDLPDDALRRVFEVNFHGVVRCVKAVLPSMLERRSGLIQIVSSVIGRRSVPGYAGYCATKFALRALADSLRVELAGTGIAVQMIYPGLTATRFADNAILRDPNRGPGFVRPMPAEKVGQAMLRAARNGRRDTVLTAGGRLLLLFEGLSPSFTDWMLARAMKTRPPAAGSALTD